MSNADFANLETELNIFASFGSEIKRPKFDWCHTFSPAVLTSYCNSSLALLPTPLRESGCAPAV